MIYEKKYRAVVYRYVGSIITDHTYDFRSIELEKKEKLNGTYEHWKCTYMVCGCSCREKRVLSLIVFIFSDVLVKSTFCVGE